MELSVEQVLKLFRNMGGTPGARERAGTERLLREIREKVLHFEAACLLASFAQDGPFRARNPYMAVGVTEMHYQGRGRELKGPQSSDFDALARRAAAGEVTLAEVKELTKPLEPNA